MTGRRLRRAFASLHFKGWVGSGRAAVFRGAGGMTIGCWTVLPGRSSCRCCTPIEVPDDRVAARTI